MASIDFHSYPHRQAGRTGFFPAWLTTLWTRISLWRQLRRERQQLHWLGDHILRDIGLTRLDVERGSEPAILGHGWCRRTPLTA